MARRSALSLTEWTVLGLLVESPRHGYDVLVELSPATPLGQAWTVRRDAVYRALDRLDELGHAEARRTEVGAAAPPRTIFAATQTGRQALRRWLDQPVEHLRDVRSALLVKLLIHERLRLDPGPLVAAQRARFEPLLERHRADPPTDPVARWRHHAAGAVAAFLDDLATSTTST